MKNLVLILSMYVLSLNFFPVLIIAHEKLSSGCGKPCSENSIPKKNPDGCEKQCCSNFSCCYKTLLFAAAYKMTDLFLPETAVKNNFTFNSNLLSFTLFDIWHPPRMV